MTNQKKLFYTILTFLSIMMLVSCKNYNYEENILAKIKKNSQINWGVKYDSRLFSIMNISKKEVEGFEIDIAKEITKKILSERCKANFIEVTSKTRVPLLKNKNIDAIIATMTVTDERKKYVDFSDIYFNAGQSLLVHKDSKIKSIEDLDKNTIVLTVKGSTSSENIKKLAKESKILEFENYSEAFIALKSYQGDVMTTDNLILCGLVKEDSSYKIVDNNFILEPYAIAVNKNQQEFLNEINRALLEIQEDGTYDKIYKKWFLNNKNDFN